MQSSPEGDWCSYSKNLLTGESQETHREEFVLAAVLVCNPLSAIPLFFTSAFVSIYLLVTGALTAILQLGTESLSACSFKGCTFTGGAQRKKRDRLNCFLVYRHVHGHTTSCSRYEPGIMASLQESQGRADRRIKFALQTIHSKSKQEDTSHQSLTQ